MYSDQDYVVDPCSWFKITSDCAFEVVAPKLWNLGLWLYKPLWKAAHCLFFKYFALCCEYTVNNSETKTKLYFTSKVVENIDHKAEILYFMEHMRAHIHQESQSHSHLKCSQY